MKISKITVWQVDLPLLEGDYKWSGGKSVEIFDSTIVAVESDCGVIGYGEVCPLGPVYLPSYAQGVRVGIEELGPNLLGAKSSTFGEVESSDGSGDEGPSLC